MVKTITNGSLAKFNELERTELTLSEFIGLRSRPEEKPRLKEVERFLFENKRGFTNKESE